MEANKISNGLERRKKCQSSKTVLLHVDTEKNALVELNCDLVYKSDKGL